MNIKELVKQNQTKIVVIALVIIIITAGIVLAVKISTQNSQPIEEPVIEEKEEVIERDSNVKIFSGDDRPIAVMIDNHSGAWPQAGLNDAYMVYEIIVEGGETRLMAVFKGKDVQKIGPVRSCRHYFLDYALENDAIYTHYGWSPQGKKDISKLGVNNINGITESTSSFWRVSDKSAPHNVATKISALKSIAESKGYRMTSTQKSILNYVSEEVNLAEGTDAEYVKIPHSNMQTVEYKFDATTKTYKRYARNRAQIDWDSKVAVTTKNIIIEFVDNYDLNDGSGKGRQGLYNEGTFDGYYITNGKAQKIKCIKKSRKEKTKYQDENGNEIKVNDGNTFVNICPKDAQVVLSKNS